MKALSDVCAYQIQRIPHCCATFYRWFISYQLEQYSQFPIMYSVYLPSTLQLMLARKWKEENTNSSKSHLISFQFLSVFKCFVPPLSNSFQDCIWKKKMLTVTSFYSSLIDWQAVQHHIVALYYFHSGWYCTIVMRNHNVTASKVTKI